MAVRHRDHPGATRRATPRTRCTPRGSARRSAGALRRPPDLPAFCPGAQALPPIGGFTHLNAVSGFSTRFGAAHPEHLVQRAAERAMTDRDAVTGAVRFAQAALDHGIRPIFGINLAVAPLARPPCSA
ncbi:PHP domain-containing protein [Streptomyces sp. NPDC001792]|uniref:PHP domain-containing protein n=1 Tax=Streptomyces sp. NPDC001792 TaxID=3154524 RepID=UPI00331BDF1D